MSRALSASLVVEGATVTCRACGQGLGPVSGIWKEAALRRETPLAEVGAPTFATGGGDVVLRHFYCPNCAALLDTETARPGDPVLVDRLRL
jgi:acetone carboxylase gamma subunit